MLKIYDDVLEVMGELREVIAAIERKDADLGRQMRRAAASVALDVAEGMGSQGGNRRARYHSALGSSRETLDCVDVAQRLYGIDASARLRDQIDKINATLFKLCG